MSDQDLKQALLHLPENASEAIVNSVFISKLLLALGFKQADQIPKFPQDKDRKQWTMLQKKN